MKLGAGTGPFCVTWSGGPGSAIKYRIELKYSPGDGSVGEQFIYEVAADIREFVFPEGDAPYRGVPVETCLKRNSFNVTVVAVLASGATEPVGSRGGTFECVRH